MPRRVAAPVLRPPLELCKPTSVRLGAGARVVVARGASEGVLEQKLAELGATALAVDVRQPAAAIEATLRGWLADGPIHGIFWLPSLDPEARLDELSIDAFRERTRVVVKNLASTMRVLYESIAASGTFLVAATRLGGLFGLGDDGTDAPLGGAVQGFVKAYRRERHDALVKVVDFTSGATDAEIADALVAEALADPGTLEVGRRAGARWSIGLDVRPVAPSPSIRLDRDSVFAVTGAAGGITSAIVADLAAASGGTFHLLDLVAPPAADDPHVALLRAGRERLKEALIAEARARGEKPTPVVIDRQLMAGRAPGGGAARAHRRAGGRRHGALARRRPARRGLRRRGRRRDPLDAAGASTCSCTPAGSRSAARCRTSPTTSGRACSTSRRTASSRCFAPRTTCRWVRRSSSARSPAGSATAARPTTARPMPCSVRCRAGCARSRPGTRAVALDWTAWGGIGMATRGSIPKIMEAAGIDMLTPEVGIPTVRRELVAGAADEVVVGGRLGILVEEWDPTGGLDVEKAQAWLKERAHPFTMVRKVRARRSTEGWSSRPGSIPTSSPSSSITRSTGCRCCRG